MIAEHVHNNVIAIMAQCHLWREYKGELPAEAKLFLKMLAMDGSVDTRVAEAAAKALEF